MGKVRSQELDNKNIGVEITYGGLESPYGGVDSSAPPAYIDPRCFADSDGFLVINNRLVCMAFESVATPALWGADTSIKFLKFGTFYNSIKGQRNYALGYKATAFAGPPSGVNYLFYVTSWNPANIADFATDQLPYTLFDALGEPVKAAITLGVISTNANPSAAGSGAQGNITAVDGSGVIQTFTVTVGGTGYAVGDAFQITQGTSTDQWAIVSAIGGGGAMTAAFIAGIPYSGYAVGPWAAGISFASSNTKLTIAGPGGTHTYTVAAASPSFTLQQIVQQFVSDINNLPDGNVLASSSIDGFSLILTAQQAGVAGNTISVVDTSVNHTITLPPPLYFTCRTATFLEGGLDASAYNAARAYVTPISVADVGGTLYFAGLGPFILKYSGPGTLAVSTSETGLGIVRKFAGSLIGLRPIPQLGTLLENQDMIFAWSAGQELDIWSPVDNNGLVTGAGFTQLADIGDYLSGLIVCNATAFIIRAQGVSYAIPTGNATLPFTFSHIGLGDQGEGSQTSALVCQYDQIGAFIGNTDVFQVASGVSSIGQKIKTAIFAAMQTAQTALDSNACAVYIGGETFPVACFLIDGDIYIFNTSNGTWMVSGIPTYATYATALLGTFASENTLANQDQFEQTSMVYGVQQTGHVPLFFQLTETVKSNSLSAFPDVIFPQEELLFGRDVTVDALYLSYNAQLVADVTVSIYISGQLFATHTFAHLSEPTLGTIPKEIQIFPTSVTDTGVFTAHSPQLEFRISGGGGGSSNLLRFTKIAMFGSFDPAQRPV